MRGKNEIWGLTTVPKTRVHLLCDIWNLCSRRSGETRTQCENDSHADALGQYDSGHKSAIEYQPCQNRVVDGRLEMLKRMENG
jgi:hypothetical protein